MPRKKTPKRPKPKKKAAAAPPPAIEEGDAAPAPGPNQSIESDAPLASRRSIEADDATGGDVERPDA